MTRAEYSILWLATIAVAALCLSLVAALA